MPRMFVMAMTTTFALLTASSALAGEGHTLFNPTPDDQRRPMTTERPSKTDSPYSIDAGRVQVETDLYAYVENDDCVDGQCTRTRQSTLGRFTNVRIGLTDTTDLQIASDLYRHLDIDDRTGGMEETRQGFGDTVVRLKKNLIGNLPTDAFSLGVLPYVKLPTNQDNLANDEYEYGIGLPFNFVLSDGWSIGGQTQFNLIAQPDGSGYDSMYVNSLIVGKSLNDKLSAYAEYWTVKADQPGARWANTVDFGLVYAVTDNFRIDANLHLGATDAADDTNLFFGTAYRF
jgi:hypothetical protein